MNTNNINDMDITEIDNFITNEECDELLKLSESRFLPSKVVMKDMDIIDTKARTSSNAFFKKSENNLIKKIENKVAKMFNVNLNQLEKIQLGKYTKGQEYKYHYDYFAENSKNSLNQRIRTVLVYLNTLNEYDGGSTKFYYLNKSIFPKKGKAVIWNNVVNGKVNTKSLHAGMPVVNDSTKYIMTIWIREKEINL